MQQAQCIEHHGGVTEPVKEIVRIRIVAGQYRRGHDRAAARPDALREPRARLDDVDRRDAAQHCAAGAAILHLQPRRERLHQALAASSGLVNSSRLNPARTSGALMNSRHSRPLRWFSIITMIGPWSIARNARAY